MSTDSAAARWRDRVLRVYRAEGLYRVAPTAAYQGALDDLENAHREANLALVEAVIERVMYGAYTWDEPIADKAAAILDALSSPDTPTKEEE